MRDASSQLALIALGAAVRAKREQQGMSRIDLSKASGVHQATIARIEHGRSDARWDTLVKLRRGLGSLADVFDSATGGAK
jgi:transcriptional regulator with XRE-family HTH domain